jgi:spore germination protein
MQIVVVPPGESVWAIARRHQVLADTIVRLNGIDNPNRLVPGQALIVPSPLRVHVVRRGELLSLIARRYQIPVDVLMQVNQLTLSEPLTPGMTLQIPIVSAPKVAIEVNGFWEPEGGDPDRRVVSESAPWLTYFSLFSYRVRTDGSLTPLNDAATLEALRPTRTLPTMTVTNFAAGTFSPEIGRAVLTDTAVRERLISQILTTMREKGYGALIIDFEHLYPEDRERYNDFLRQIAPNMRTAGFPFGTALAPKTSAAQTGSWYGAHDYPAHGQIVDFTILMTYEWGWSGGPPLPVAPIPEVARVLDYAVTVIPRDKIMLGVPMYGYDWTLPYVQGGPFARSLTPQGAVDLAARRGAVIRYDRRAKAPYFRYTDNQGNPHIVWFEDARSLLAKFRLVKNYRLRGLSYWTLGKDFPQNAPLLLDEFIIRKRK